MSDETKTILVDDWDVTHESTEGQPSCGLKWTDEDGFPGAYIVFDQIVPQEERVWCERCNPDTTQEGTTMEVECFFEECERCQAEFDQFWPDTPFMTIEGVWVCPECREEITQ